MTTRPRVIVTFARGWQSLAITRSLGKQGIDVYCGEEAPFAPSFFSKYCKGNFRYPSVSKDPEGFLDALEAKVKELKPPEGVPYVLMPVHKETWLIAQHRERFEPYITVPLTTHENMALVHDKGRIPDLAEKLSVPIPPTHRFKSVDELYQGMPGIKFPVFLKVREGASGVGIEKCKTPEQLSAAYKRFVDGFKLGPDEQPLVQEAVPGTDYCVTMLFNQGKCVAKMSYGNLRQFPRETGASALRESVPLPEAEEHGVRMLEDLNWHGIAELDFRQEEGGTPYLIEINPRFFGGLSQAVASNVDYPYLLYKIAAGEEITPPEVDYSAKTEVPLTGLIATLDEIARDDKTLGKLKALRDEAVAMGNSDIKNPRIKPFLDALFKASNPADLVSFVRGKFAEHQGSVNDVITSDDPMPALGALYPVALMLKHGKVSMGLLTGEDQLKKDRPRRGFRHLLRYPNWGTIALTAGLFALSGFLAHWEPTRDNVGWLLGWPLRLAAKFFGESPDRATPMGALVHTLSHVLNIAFLFLCSILLVRERAPVEESDQGTNEAG